MQLDFLSFQQQQMLKQIAKQHLFAGKQPLVIFIMLQTNPVLGSATCPNEIKPLGSFILMTCHVQYIYARIYT